MSGFSKKLRGVRLEIELWGKDIRISRISYSTCANEG